MESLCFIVDGPGVIVDLHFGNLVNDKFFASFSLEGNPASNLIFFQVAQGSPGSGKPAQKQ